MQATASYFWSVLVFLLIVGALLYVADRVWGTKIRRLFWSLTHSKDEPYVGRPVGFIYGQRFGARLGVATFLAVVETAVSIWLVRVGNPLVELMYGVVDIPVFIAGFYLGPLMDRFVTGVKIVSERIEEAEERIESGETTLRGELGSAASTAYSRAREEVSVRTGGSAGVAGGRKAAGEPPVQPAPAKPPDPPAPDPAAGIDRYLGRRR